MAGLLSNRPFCSNDLMILSAYMKSRWSINCTYFRCTVLLLLLLMESRTQNMYYYYTGGFSSPSLVNLSCHIWPKNCVSRKFCLMSKFNSHFQTINLYIGSGDDTDLPENMTLYLNIMKSVFDHANYQGSFQGTTD